MTTKKTITLYEDHPQGSLKATVVGAFQRNGETLMVIRPGYDAQGRRRTTWTQVVYGDVPIWEWKRDAPLPHVLDQFDRLWKQTVGRDVDAARKGLAMTVSNRRTRFRDGVAGVEPAPALTRDGRPSGMTYVG